MEKPRLLMVDLGSHYGGVETYVEGLFHILSVHMEGYAICSLPPLAAALRAQGATVVCLPLLGSKWFKPLRLVLACVVIPWLLWRYTIRTVQLNGYFESWLLGPLRLLRCKTIYTMHGPFETEMYSWLRNPARLLPRFLSRHSLRFATQVVCVSETVGEVARGVLSADRVRVIPNWVILPGQFRRNFASAAPAQLLFVGRLEAYKGVQLLLEAMRQIPDLSLIVVGEGSYRATLEALAGNLNVKFAGFQADVSKFYEQCTIFVNPSLGPEGLPLVSLEAMACGLPCIFSDLPVHVEISGNGRAGALFRKGECASLTRQLRLLLASEELRKRYGEAARSAIIESYSLKQATHRYVQVFGLSSASTFSDTSRVSQISNHQVALADD